VCTAQNKGGGQCKRAAKIRGLCRRHYRRWYRSGDWYPAARQKATPKPDDGFLEPDDGFLEPHDLDAD
jgi:hypothetical protein